MNQNEWETLLKYYEASVEGLRQTFERCIHSGATVHKFGNLIGLVSSSLYLLRFEIEKSGGEQTEKITELQKKFLERLAACAEWLGAPAIRGAG